MGFNVVEIDGKPTVKSVEDPVKIDDNGGSITVDGSVSVSNFPSTQPVSGTVAVSNLPAVQPVSDNGGSLTVDGTVAISNLPATQPVSGTVTANAGTGPWPVTDNGGSITVDGAVSVTNFPATQAVSGPLTDAQLRASAVSVSIAGSTGTSNVQVVKGANVLDIDATGRVGLQSSGVDGQPVPGKALQIGGKDTDGNLQSIATDTTGRIITAPAGATSLYAGFMDGNIITSAATTVAVRSTTYTEQASNAQRSLRSANAADAAAGAGARKVRIVYFDATMAGPFIETVTLNGTTAVNTVATNICFIERMEVTEAGANGVPSGIITLHSAINAGGTAIGTIAANTTRTFWSHHYVASGRTCYVTGQTAGVARNTQGSTFFISKKSLVANSAEIQITEGLRTAGNQPATIRQYGTPIEVVGPARLVQYATPDGTQNVTQYGSFDFYEQ